MTFTIMPMPAPVEPALIDRLGRCSTATIGHFENAGIVSGTFSPVIAGRRIAGTAVTVSLTGLDSVLVHYVLSGVRPGDVLVIGRGGERDHSAWGATTALAASRAGVAGVIVDGPTVDIAGQRETGLACWAAGVSALTTRKLGTGGGINVPVEIGGVTVHPGDAVLADDTGIYICAPERVGAVIDEALAREQKRPATIARLEAGEKLGELSGANEMVRRALWANGVEPPW